MLNYEPINTTYKKINTDIPCGELCRNFKKIMNANSGLEGSKKTVSIYFSPLEKDFLSSFLKLNNTSFAELLRYIYLMDNAMPVAYIKAIEDIKMISLGFVNLGENGFDTSYFNKYKDCSPLDFENAFKERGVAKTNADRAVLIEQVDIHRKEKGYNTMTAYIKRALIQIVYPPDARMIAKLHIRTDYGKKLSESDLKKKRKRQEKDAEVRIAGHKNPQAVINKFKMNVSTANLETELFNSFKDALKKHGITFSAITKYRMIQENTITRNMVKISDKDFELCSNFSYERPKAQGDTDWYIQSRRDREGEGRKVNNVAITTTVRDAIYDSMGKGNFSQWVKKNVLDYYNMYPVVEGKSIVEIILRKYKKRK